jgi:hypothetical protein
MPYQLGMKRVTHSQGVTPVGKKSRMNPIVYGIMQAEEMSKLQK